MKYKVGDKVRVRSGLKGPGLYYMEDCRISDIFVSDMREYCGEVVTIQSISSVGKYRIQEDGGRWNWTDGMLERPATTSKIIITTDGKTTTAKLFNGKDLVKSAEAKCSPHDEFDFEKGAAIAVDRLLGREEKKEEVLGFKKEYMVNGRFGRMSNGKWFVIVGDSFIYESGGFDKLSRVDSEGYTPFYSIDYLADALSFNHVKSNRPSHPVKVIWKRPGAKFE